MDRLDLRDPNVTKSILEAFPRSEGLLFQKSVEQGETIVWGDSDSNPVVLLCHQSKPWDSEVLGWQVAAISCFLVKDGGNQAVMGLAHDYATWLAEAGYDLVSARLDPGQILAIQALESVGFRFVEIYVTLERDLTQHPPQEVALDVVVAGPEDAEQVGEIAARIFTYDRLHADPRIDNCLADRFKRAWGAHSCRGYADRVLLARVDGQIAGFITLRRRRRVLQGDEVALIDLIGVSRGFQGRGVGKALVEAACAWARERGLALIDVGTQAANKGSVGMYRKLGFTVTELQVTLQWVREGASANMQGDA